jgi:hypothetical protein
MNNEELVKELTSIKDPETLIRRGHHLDPKILSKLIGVGEDDTLLNYVVKAIINNPEITKKIKSEAYEVNLEEAREANQKAIEEAHNVYLEAIKDLPNG